MLISTVLQKELWLVPGPEPRAEVSPVLMHTFEYPVMGLVEAGWTPGGQVSPEIIHVFDDRVRSLNGACLLGPGVLAVADCFAGLIWRVDLTEDGRGASSRVWLADPSMAWDPDGAAGVHAGAGRPGVAAAGGRTAIRRGGRPDR